MDDRVGRLERSVAVLESQMIDVRDHITEIRTCTRRIELAIGRKNGSGNKALAALAVAIGSLAGAIGSAVTIMASKGP